MPAAIEIRDPIHGSITVLDDEVPVLDHPWVQRLRHIRQLGFVSLVYPGAVHDRFQHSLGVMHLAGLCFDDLRDRCRAALADFSDADLDYARRIVRLAGLLHDVGHAPFSHTAEEHLGPVDSVVLPADWYRQGRAPQGRRAHHEDYTLAIIHEFAASGVMAPDVARDVAAVLAPELRRSPRLAGLGSLVALLRALISGEVDADRCDYLLRDSHATGVSYGRYDLPRLRACLRVVAGPEGPELGLDAHGVHVLEELLLARYHMFLQVYFHKTPPAFEHYLGRALAEGEFALSFARGLADLRELRDDVVIGRLHDAAGRGSPWSRRIVAREAAPLLLRERVGEGDTDSLRLINALQKAGCRVFWRRSRQRFTNLAGAGSAAAVAPGSSPSLATGTRLLCEQRLLGRSRLEPVAYHSHLLAAFNRPIDLQYTYVLRDDAARARAVLDGFNSA
jgi:hypothetical protein